MVDYMGMPEDLNSRPSPELTHPIIL